MKNHDAMLLEQLDHALRGDEAHIEFGEAVKDFPIELAGKKPHGVPHSGWELLEHLRIAQEDILEFSRNPKHKSPKWPDSYWPKNPAPASEKAWEKSVAAFRADAKAMNELVANAGEELYEPIKGGDGQTLLREALVLAAHNSYHLGQLVFLKKMLVDEGD